MASKQRSKQRKVTQQNRVTTPGTEVQETHMVDSNTSTATPVINYTNNTNERVHQMALTAEQIASLLGKSRTKGEYLVKLKDFLESNEGGICVNDTWIEMKDRKASTLKQGFENAITHKDAPEGSDGVKVMKDEDKVYLINLRAAGIEVEQAAAA